MASKVVPSRPGLDTLDLTFALEGPMFTTLHDLNPLARSTTPRTHRVACVEITDLDLLHEDHPNKGSRSAKCVWKAKLIETFFRPGDQRTVRLYPEDERERKPIVIKFARGEDARERLLREYNMYEKDLKKFQGMIIPNCYGIFGTRTARRGPMLTCLLLEYCPPLEVPDNEQGKFRQTKIQAIKLLVSEGILHGNITEPSHFLPLKEKGVYGVYIVSFSNAKVINPEVLQIYGLPADSKEDKDESMTE